jgi:uncharacterized protein
MNIETQTPHHSLNAEQFAALAQGGGDAATIGQLVAAQGSKHLILLGKVKELAQHADRPDGAIAMAGFRLLAHVQRRDAAAAAKVIGYPSVGAWALHVIRANGASAQARPGGVAAIAAAAAIRAGLDAEIEVPVVNSTVLLPSLGAARAVGCTAIVATKAAQVRSGDLRVTICPGAPGWQELKRITVGALDVHVDDLDPFRMPATDGEATDRLTEQQLAELRDILRTAWPVLSPANAAEIAAIVRVIVPYQAPRSGYASTSSPQAFGTVAMSRQPCEYTCAETLVHETQHLKLSALLDLVTLTLPDDGQRYYAPWRTDPRPASGLLQGAYAYLGVTGFWREQRRVAPEPKVRQRAQVEFARWRDGAAVVVETLLGSEQLTRLGEVFAEAMAGVLDAWRGEAVPGDALAIARLKSDRHLAQWQMDNG